MTQPPAQGSGPAEEPARDSGLPGGGAGGSGSATGRERAGAPGGRRAAGGGRDPRLAGFGQDGAGDACPPGAALAAVVAELSGPEWRCDGASDDELTGLLGRWEALESWAAAGKLGVVRELLRRRARSGPRGVLPKHGDLPDQWHEGTAHEVSAALGISVPSADNLLGLAWDLQARLPGIGAALADGRLSPWKAKLISDELSVLDDELAAQAEKLILDQMGAQTTPGALGKLAAQAACTVDPDGAAKRREYAEREKARVRFWRENGGACALAAYGLPTDAALAANAAIHNRALGYKSSKIRPDARMDQLRVLAFLDLLNGITLQDRITLDNTDVAAGAGDGDHTNGGGDASPRDAHGAGSTSGNGSEASTRNRDRHDDSASYNGPAGRDSGHPDGAGPRDGTAARNGGNDAGADPGGRDDAGADPGGRNGDGHAPDGTPPNAAPAGPALTARANLTLPLATLLGLASRPGTAHGLGPLDPALVRDLAAAANSPHTQWCMTITDQDGVAIAHGCARPARTSKARAPAASRDGPLAGTSWALTRRGQPAPPGGYGSWTLTLPGGRDLHVNLEPIPVTGCDHRHESAGYQPSDTLRHLVQVRDGTCTFPTCSRHARESDFEHAIPYHKGGRTCACNGGARSRRCHHVKQSDGWTVTQPQPGWHQWVTPSGRTYTRGPTRYPA